jgi:hypothetical protein
VRGAALGLAAALRGDDLRAMAAAGALLGRAFVFVNPTD